MSLSQIKQERARRSLSSFTRYTFPGYQANWHHDLLCRYLDQFVAGEITRLLVFMPPRHGKPMYNSVMILMADGTYKQLGEIRVGDRVISHTGQSRRVVAVHEQGRLPTVRVTTQSGRETVAALDHPFLTPEGWVKAGDLAPGMVLANLPLPMTQVQISTIDEKFRLAGYFIGDGATTYTSRGSSINAKITAFDATERADIEHCAGASGFGIGKADGADITLVGGVRMWLREIGLAGCGSHTKRVPLFVFSGSTDQIGQFIGAYFACDGHINRKGNARTDAAVEFYSVNRGLLSDLQRLLLRLGVQSRVAAKISNNNVYTGGLHTSYRLTISSQDDVARFAYAVPIHHAKAETLQNWGVYRTEFDRQYLEDPIVTVTPDGEHECRCLTVEQDHTFTADDFVVHNSELVSRRLPAFIFGRDPDARIIAASYSADLASRMNRDVQRIIDSPLYAEVFPETALNGTNVRTLATGSYLRNSDIFEIVGHSGSYRGTGIGGGITGLGGDWLILDDPVKNREEADSATYRERQWEWYTSTFYTRREKNARILITLTRWHEDDLAGRLLERAASDPNADQWTVLSLPAIADGELHTDDPRQPGQALWPDKYNETELTKIKTAVGSRNWEALYQQRPAPAEGGTFKRGWWQFYREPPSRFDELLQSWDMTFKDTKGADYVVGQVWGRVGADRYLLAQTRDRMNFPTTIQAVRTLSAQWPAAHLKLVEDKANGPAVIDSLRKEIGGLVPVMPQGSKEARAAAVSPQIEAGNVYLPDPSIAPWIGEFIEECAAFPNGAHDDQVDAMTQALARFTQRNRILIGRAR